MTELTLPLFEKGWTLEGIFKMHSFHASWFLLGLLNLGQQSRVSEPAGGPLPSGSKGRLRSLLSRGIRGNKGGNYRLAVAAAPGWAVSTLAKKHSWKVTPGSKPTQESRRQPLLPLQPHSHPGVPIMDRSEQGAAGKAESQPQHHKITTQVTSSCVEFFP